MIIKIQKIIKEVVNVITDMEGRGSKRKEGNG